jgi:tetratricopeptide (TPR) repeat protein
MRQRPNHPLLQSHQRRYRPNRPRCRLQLLPHTEPGSGRGGAAALLIAASLVTIILRGHLHASVPTAPHTAGSHHVPDPEAEQFYLKGRYYWSRRTPESLSQAIDAFTQAVVHDSEYAQAYAGLAECYDLMPEFTSMPRAEAFPRAIAAGRKAVALDDSLGEAHRALGFALFYWEWKVPAALGEYQRALALDPRDEEAHHWYATSLLALGRMQQARSEIDRAQQLNPASRSILCDQALIHFYAGDRAAAIARLQEIEQAEPDFLSAPRYLAGTAFSAKDYRTFIAQSKRAAALSGDKQELALANAAQAGFARGGERGLLEAMRAVEQRNFDSGQSSGWELARLCALLGKDKEAVIALKGAVAAQDYNVLSVATNPDFSKLDNDPSFQDLVRQITERAYRA